MPRLANVLLVLLLLPAQQALAVGLEIADPTATAPALPDCDPGHARTGATEACIAQTTDDMTDDQRIEAARELAAQGDYAQAAAVLLEADNPDDLRILNFTGYTLRKSGNPTDAMGYYRRALELDPGYLDARSYLGQALVDLGDLEGARAQLIEIRKRGGRGTWAYTSLKQAIIAKTGY